MPFHVEVTKTYAVSYACAMHCAFSIFSNERIKFMPRICFFDVSFMVVFILPAVNLDWLIYSKPLMHIHASQSISRH